LVLRARIAIGLGVDGDVEAVQAAIARAIAAVAKSHGFELWQLQLAPTADPSWAFEGPSDVSDPSFL
jgi:hypothetical protein